LLAKYAHKIPFIVKINHNEFISYPNKFDQIMFGTVEDAWNMGAVAVGATIYFGSPESGRQIVEVAQAFESAHELGMATILWCYTRNNAFQKRWSRLSYCSRFIFASKSLRSNHSS
jgi:class I fructose-bisphosphate aldolase